MRIELNEYEKESLRIGHKVHSLDYVFMNGKSDTIKVTQRDCAELIKYAHDILDKASEISVKLALAGTEE